MRSVGLAAVEGCEDGETRKVEVFRRSSALDRTDPARASADGDVCAASAFTCGARLGGDRGAVAKAPDATAPHTPTRAESRTTRPVRRPRHQPAPPPEVASRRW